MVLGELKKMIQLEKFVKSQKNIKRFVVFRGENYTQTDHILIKTTATESCGDPKKIFK